MKNTENALKKEDVIVEEVAIKELQKYVETFKHEEVEDWKIKDDYPQLLKALRKGLVEFDKDMKPSYKLAFPIKTDEGNIAVSDITFRTRIKPSDLANITKGLDVPKHQFEFIIRSLCYITGETKTMLDKFDWFDYKVIEQISTVFL